MICHEKRDQTTSSADERECVGSVWMCGICCLCKEHWKHLEVRRPSQQVERVRPSALNHAITGMSVSV